MHIAPELKLTASALDSLHVRDILFAEINTGVVSQEEGGVLLFVLREGEFECYLTPRRRHEGLCDRVREMVAPHADLGPHGMESPAEALFDLYEGGMGTVVYIRKGMAMEIAEESFTGILDGTSYLLECSGRSTFEVIAKGIFDRWGLEDGHSGWKE